MKVGEVMTKDVMWCRVDDTLADCANMMKELNVGATPVVDQNENLVGIITDRDMTVRAIARGVDVKNAKVADFMTPSPITVNPDTNVEDAADIMADAQIRRLPVVQDNRIIGIVSIGDLAVDVGEEEIIAEVLERVSEPTR